MSRPEWDGVTQSCVTWDDVRLPCVLIAANLPDDEEAWYASLPMENRCTLDLHVPRDAAEPVYVTVACDIAPREWPADREWPTFFAGVAADRIVLRQERLAGIENPDDRLFHVLHLAGQMWHEDVADGEEVLAHLAALGRMRVVRE